MTNLPDFTVYMRYMFFLEHGKRGLNQPKRGVVVVGCLTVDVGPTRDEELDRAQVASSGSLTIGRYRIHNITSIYTVVVTPDIRLLGKPDTGIGVL